VHLHGFVGYAGGCFSKDLGFAGFSTEVLLCRSQWPRSLRRGSATARLLELWVRNYAHKPFSDVFDPNCARRLEDASRKNEYHAISGVCDTHIYSVRSPFL